MSQPLVSVIIPLYNSEKYISHCVESIKKQDYCNIEIIVIDDGSTDQSVDIVKKNFKNIILVRQENAGACAARNRGLSLASGKYVKFLDSDDFLEAGAISRQVRDSESAKEKEIIYGDYNLFTDRKYFSNTKPNYNDNVVFSILSDILTSTPLHKLCHLKAVGGFDVRFKNGQEWNLHVRLAAQGFKFVHKRGAVYNYRSYDSKDRISNQLTKKGKERAEHDIEKILLTMHSIAGTAEKPAYDALAKRLWWVGRRSINLGYTDLATKAFAEAKNITNNYKRYWPISYRISYFIFGVEYSERIISYLRKRIH